MTVQTPAGSEPELRQRRIEPIFDASGTLRRVPSTASNSNEAPSRTTDRITGHASR
ncbi:MAG: hypothetical protein Q7S99_10375 [Parvibaculum sp.]|nr:hypothetical protein [Parvibaculum sp.]